MSKGSGHGLRDVLNLAKAGFSDERPIRRMLSGKHSSRKSRRTVDICIKNIECKRNSLS